MLEINVSSLAEGGIPFEKYMDGMKDSETKKKYTKNLEIFLDMVPNSIYDELLSKKPDSTIQSKASCFVEVGRINPIMVSNIIKEYIKYHKKRAAEKQISPNTVPNYIKPIKVLTDTNDIALHWKRLYKLFPREQKSKDRAYTIQEVQKMFKLSHDLTDKVIIAMFSSSGFRLESWDYFTWRDIVFFPNEDGTFRGMAVRVYGGDPEEYWTFGTPESATLLNLYREKWKKDIGSYPQITDPLLRVTSQLVVKRMRQKGVRKRVQNLAEEAGLRPPLKPGQKRYAVKLDHGFRKFFNTMMRRAKVDFADKEDMMGHKIALESSYERYEEQDFERFPEYQKVIPFLTIDDTERQKLSLIKLQNEKDMLNIKVNENIELEAQLKEERLARIKFEQEIKQTLAKLREEKLTNYKAES